MGIPLFYANKSEDADNNLRRPRNEKIYIWAGYNGQLMKLNINPLP